MFYEKLKSPFKFRWPGNSSEAAPSKWIRLTLVTGGGANRRLQMGKPVKESLWTLSYPCSCVMFISDFILPT